jgi:8-oxo-dGTP pyrophosphatase MutT (NUDIX family)
VPEPLPVDLPTIRVAALALIRDRRLLMVTARGRDVMYLPGGKIDPGETPAEAAAREAFEEVSVRVDASSLRRLFTLRVQAHGEPEGRLVEMHVFAGETPDEPRPSNEVDAVHWVTTADTLRCPPAGTDTLARLHAAALID